MELGISHHFGLEVYSIYLCIEQFLQEDACEYEVPCNRGKHWNVLTEIRVNKY